MTLAEFIVLLSMCQWPAAGGAVMATFVTLLTDRAKFMRSWDSPIRPVLGTMFGLAGTVLGLVEHGTLTTVAIASVIAGVLPTILAEIAAFTHGKVSASRAALRGFSTVADLWPLAFAAVLFASACALLKPAARTANDFAREACEAYAAEQADTMKLSVEDAIKGLCVADEMMKPWIDAWLAAKKNASAIASAKYAAAHRPAP